MILKGIEELKSFLGAPRNIVIVGHRNPDGDAMGAALGLKHYLDKKGHQATVVVPNEYPDFLHWLPGSETTYRFDWQNSQSQREIKNFDDHTPIDTIQSRNENYNRNVKQSVTHSENIDIKNYMTDKIGSRRDSYAPIERQRSHSHKVLKKNAQEMIDKINILLTANSTMLEKHNTIEDDEEI